MTDDNQPSQPQPVEYVTLSARCLLALTDLARAGIDNTTTAIELELIVKTLVLIKEQAPDTWEQRRFVDEVLAALAKIPTTNEDQGDEA